MTNMTKKEQKFFSELQLNSYLGSDELQHVKISPTDIMITTSFIYTSTLRFMIKKGYKLNYVGTPKNGFYEAQFVRTKINGKNFYF